MRTPTRILLFSLITMGWAGAGFRAFADEELLAPDRLLEEAIDFYIEQGLERENLQPAPRASEATLLRRTMLDLVGRPPTVVEVRRYLPMAPADPQSSREKQKALVDRLMGSDEFIEHQTNEFDTLLMEGSGGSLKGYLSKALKENRPWDRMFREMLIGEEGDEKQNGAIQFIRTRARDLDKLTNQSSVIFFGVNISCAKCHDHPLVPDWTQDHFYGMKSFFSRTFENGGFVAERDYGELNFKTTSGESRKGRLMFLTGAVIEEPSAKPKSAKQKKEEKKLLAEFKKKKQPPPPPNYSRRTQLVEAALQPHPQNFFSRAIVNHLWRRLMGHGLVSPVDQMHSQNPASHPRLLAWLARDFQEHGYDVRRLIGGIVLSGAYARSSRWEKGPRPAAKHFAVAQVRPLTPMQYAALLRLASANPDQFSADQPATKVAARLKTIAQKADSLAKLFEQPRGDFQISASEALLMSNNAKIETELLRDSADSLLGKLKTIDDSREVVETAVWSVFGRPVQEQERRILVDYLARRHDRPLHARKQLVWALLTSSPCRFNY